MITKLQTKIQHIGAKIIPYVLPLLCLSVLLAFVSFGEKYHNEKICHEVKVNIYPEAVGLISKDNVTDLLKDEELSGMEGKLVRDVNMKAIEKVLISHPHIRNASVFANMKGTVHLNIQQRLPFFRIINSGGRSFYIDRNGGKMPLSEHYTYHALVVRGHIEEPAGSADTLTTKQAEELFDFIRKLKNDDFMRNLTGEVYVQKDGELEIVPRLGKSKILLGDFENMDEKFTKLRSFYREALPEVGWDHYTSINLKYNNQIIAKN